MTGADADAWIGLDLGTSGLKGVALSASGEVLARASAGYPTRRPVPRAAEQQPGDWLAATRAGAGKLAGQVPAGRWRAIGLAAMMPTLVPVSARGEVTGPAITWEDSRAEHHGDLLRAACGADRLYRATGQWVDGRYLLPMFLRLAQDQPGLAGTVAALLSAKDYLFGWLTGEPATDPSTAAGYGCYRLSDGQWDDAVLAAAGRLAGDAIRPALPAVRPASTTRPVRAELAADLGCGRIPVCLGAADSVLGAFGLGARQPGQIAYVAGTSTVILGITDRLVLDPDHRFLVTPLAEPGRWGLEMDLLATGGALRWLAGLLGDGLDEPGVIALAGTADPQDAPVMLPYLSPGEQGALWDPALHGVIAGLTLGHGRAHLARGLVNGIVLESRRCLAVLDETAVFGPDLLVAGGSAAESAFRADLADASGRRVVMPGAGDTAFSAVGAALLARQAAGLQAPPGGDAPGNCEPGVRAARVAVPDPGRTASWDRIWASYERARLAFTGRT